MIRIIGVIAGLLIIALNYRTFVDILKFYFKPTENEPEFKLLVLKDWIIFQVLIIHLGLSALVLFLVPESDATIREIDLPKNIFVILLLVAIGVGIEEWVFRIVPWINYYLCSKEVL